MQKKKLNSRKFAEHKKRFLQFFPKAFRDQRYLQWEHEYKMVSHRLWEELLNEEDYTALLKKQQYDEIAARALRVESSTKPPFLFSFEKMALRDALRDKQGAKEFALGLNTLLYGDETLKERFIQWIVSVSQLPRKQSRVLSWPVLTYFPFIAQPTKHMILKPTAMKVAAGELEFDLEYSSKPNYTTYKNLLDLAELVQQGISDLKPRNFHDVQTFLWVIGSDEYAGLEENL